MERKLCFLCVCVCERERERERQMKAIISLEISSAGYSETRRHVPENKVAILNPVHKIFLQYEKTKEILDSTEEK